MLATFVQISDLHIGEIDPGSGDAQVSGLAKVALQNSSWFDGLMGHHGVALQDLEVFCADLTADGEEFRLIVTGDFTQCGGVTELETAKKYLVDSVDLSPPNQILTGLRLGEIELIIPGNHDHWGGFWQPVGGKPSNYQNVLGKSTPRVHQPIRLGNGRDVVFIGIDSDADIHPDSAERGLALGHFVSNLMDPRARPARGRSGAEIRMMLIHHSWNQSGTTLKMDPRSKQALGQFLFTNDVKAILTGHSHAPLLHPFTVATSNGSVDVQELRAGTTTQHDHVPLNWLNLLGQVPKRNWPQNSLLLHRVFEQGDATVWEVAVYVRSLQNGFEPMQGRGSSLAFLV